MARRLALTIDGRSEEIEILREDGGLRVRLGDRLLDVEFAPTNRSGLYSLIVDGRSWEVFARERPGGYDLLVGNRVYEVDVGRGVRSTAEPEAVTGVWTLVSPMSGQVVELRVADGEQVEAGQTLAVIESMKMNNELTAAKAGTVRDLQVGAGERVEKSRVLLRIE